MARDSAQWATILQKVGCAPSVALSWGSVLADEITDSSFSKGDADIWDWLPEILHESAMLTVLEENLNYSAQRLIQVWPTRFMSVAQAMPYAYNPQKLANLVYGGRMGNTRTNDGWTYRGRSPLQITGLANYKALGDLMGQDLVGIPDLLAQPRFGCDACIRWWEGHIPDSMLGETTSIRQRVNGGTVGLADVQMLTARVKAAMAQEAA